MTAPRVELTIAGAVATLTLARPEKLNALDQAMLGEIEAAVQAIEEARAVRVAILIGQGDRAFSAGGDIGAWAGLDPLSFARLWVRGGHRVFDRLARLRQPLIAALNGHAMGGGLELAATADLIVAEDWVTLSMPETGLGMVPGWSGTQRLVRRFGSRAVKRMAVLGERITATDAVALGLVDALAPRGHGLARAQELAAQIAARGPVAVQLVKQLVNAAEGEERDAALESLASAAVAMTADLAEGVSAFREKRAAQFNDR
jgi:enoyl-CoA hydratase/carnithine racemase